MLSSSPCLVTAVGFAPVSRDHISGPRLPSSSTMPASTLRAPFACPAWDGATYRYSHSARELNPKTNGENVLCESVVDGLSHRTSSGRRRCTTPKRSLASERHASPRILLSLSHPPPCVSSRSPVCVCDRFLVSFFSLFPVCCAVPRFAVDRLLLLVLSLLCPEVAVPFVVLFSVSRDGCWLCPRFTRSHLRTAASILFYRAGVDVECSARPFRPGRRNISLYPLCP